MGHFEKGKYVEEFDIIEQLFGFKIGGKYEDPHTKSINQIVEHINTQIAPAFRELATNVNELNERLKLLERQHSLELSQNLMGV